MHEFCENMKTIFVGMLILAFCCACHSGKGKAGDANGRQGEAVDSLLVDSASLGADSMAVTAIPRNADELFDDFIYNYAGDEALQKARTVFPLPYIKEGVKEFIEESEWEHDHLFTKENYYTLLYDKEQDMELEKNLELDSVTVEWLYLDTHEIRQYHFQRQEGLWMLASMEQRSTLDEPYEDFLEFFHKFSNDSIFQREHIAVPLKFVTSDPDDEFQILETTLEIDQWFTFKPLLPVNRMTNIDYGQKHSKNSRRQVIDLRGIGNGFSNTLFFKRIRGEWKLVQFDDLSN